MFSKCPHCGASILDDTEELCPSCDQPLKGAAKPAAKAAPAAKPTKKSAAEKPDKQKEKPAKPALEKSSAGDASDDDDPFDIGGQAGKRATRVHPKPAKGRMYRVECPMCESPGFVSKAAAGEEVRCWNKECKLPLFKAPAIEKEPEPEPEPKKKPIAAIALVLILVVGGGVGAWFALNPGTEEKRLELVTPVNNDPENSEENTNPSLVTVDPNANKGPQVATNADIVADALAALPDRVTDPNNASLDDSNRLAAEAFTLAGNLAEADAMLASIRTSAAFYKVRPLVLRASQLIESGDEAAANTIADEALDLASRLPRSGRESLDWATDLAVLLVRLNRVDDAAQLIEKHHDAGIRGEYSALLAGARNSGTYDLADVAGGTLIRNTPNPQWVAVTRGLVSLGKRDQALAWAKRGSGAVASDSLAAWAGTLGADETVDADAIAQEAKSPTLAARLLGAAGLEIVNQAATRAPQPAAEPESATPQSAPADAAEAANEATASAPPAQAVAILQTALSNLPSEPGAAMEVPGLRAIYDSARLTRSGLADPAEIRTEALAYLKVAELQYAINKPDAAWKTLRTGLERLRTYAPGPDAAKQLVDEYENRQNSVRSQLENELELDTRSKVNTAFNRYRRQVDAFQSAADNRFALQERLANVAIANGSEAQLVEWIESAADEPWWSSSTATALTQSEDAAIAAAVKSKVASDLPPSPQPWRRIVTEAIEKGDVISLAQRLRRLKNDNHTQGLWAGVAASLLVRNQQEAQLQTFIEYLTLETVRADVIEMSMSQAMKRGNGPKLFETFVAPGARFTPHELVATYRGAAVAADEKPSAPPETATDAQ